jgi:hypothetical protein
MSKRSGMYSSNKRKKELSRKKKQEEKRMRRQKEFTESATDPDNTNAPGDEPGSSEELGEPADD